MEFRAINFSVAIADGRKVRVASKTLDHITRKQPKIVLKIYERTLTPISRHQNCQRRLCLLW